MNKIKVKKYDSVQEYSVDELAEMAISVEHSCEPSGPEAEEISSEINLLAGVIARLLASLKLKSEDILIILNLSRDDYVSTEKREKRINLHSHRLLEYGLIAIALRVNESSIPKYTGSEIEELFLKIDLVLGVITRLLVHLQLKSEDVLRLLKLDSSSCNADNLTIYELVEKSTEVFYSCEPGYRGSEIDALHSKSRLISCIVGRLLVHFQSKPEVILDIFGLTNDGRYSNCSHKLTLVED